MDGRPSWMEVMKFAVLGDPISHSKSPAIHGAAYEFLGLDWKYEAYQVASGELETFLETALASFDGFSLTMPLKESLVAIAAKRGWSIDPFAAQLKAGNTLYKDVAGQWCVANTDVHGAGIALASVAENVSSVALLGSGATARSIALALSLGCPALSELTVFSRRPEPAEEIFKLLAIQMPATKASWLPLEAAADFGGADVTINTLPGATATDYEVDIPFGESWIFDVTYSPWPTALASNWPEEFRISGLEMLIWQAVEQLRLFGAIPSEFDSGRISELAAAMRLAAI